MHKYILPIALLLFSAAAQGTIYQCGNSFQGHPCQGAKVISGAPTTDDDQSGARYSQMKVQREQAQRHVIAPGNRQACVDAQTTYAQCKALLTKEAHLGKGVASYPPAELAAAENCIAAEPAQIAEFCH